VRTLPLLALLAAAGPAYADNEPRVLVIPVTGEAPKKLGALIKDVEAALSDGAGKTTPNVAKATASLDDTAVIVGCDPKEKDCLDQVAAALNVDQLLIADISTSGQDAVVDLTAVTREADPVQQSFTIHATTRADDLKKLEDAVPVMLEAGEARVQEAHKVVPPPPPPPPPPHPVVVTPPPPPPHATSRLPLYVAGGGAAVAAIGSVFWMLESSKQDQIDAAPTRTGADLDRLASLESSAKLYANVGNVAVIAGGVAIAAGVGWYIYEKRHGHEVTVTPTAGGAAVTIGGTW